MAFDCYLQISSPDVKGESTDKAHQGWIQVEGFDFNVANPTTISSGTTGSGSGKATLSTITIHKWTDKASPVLYQACCSGEHFGKATLVARKSGKNPLEYMIINFTEFYVSSLTTRGSTGEKEDVPREDVEFSYSTIHIKYVPQKADGSGDSPIEGGWDVKQNAPK